MSQNIGALWRHAVLACGGVPPVIPRLGRCHRCLRLRSVLGFSSACPDCRRRMQDDLAARQALPIGMLSSTHEDRTDVPPLQRLSYDPRMATGQQRRRRYKHE